MFYALTIVTLLATILFYSFYPRNDGIRTVDMPTQKAIVMQLVAQHAAAVEAARIVSYDHINQRNQMAYEQWTRPQGEEQHVMVQIGSQIPDSLYDQFLPPGFQRGYAFTSLYCIDNSNGLGASECGVRKADSTRPTLQQGTTDLIVSYMLPDDKLQYRALGETVYLTNYSDAEHLKINCGIATCDLDGCIVDNTRYQTVTLPASFNGLDGMLVCVTQLSVAYDSNGQVVPMP